MPEIIIPEDCGQVVSKWALTGKNNLITSTCGVRWIDGGSADPQGMLDEFRGGWVQDGGMCDASEMTVGWSFIGCSMVFNNGGDMEGYETADAPVVGTSTANGIPVVNASLIVRKRTGLVGRHFRGRMFLPILQTGEASIDPMGVIEPTVAFPAVVARMAITADFWQSSVTWRPVLLHSDTVVTPGYTTITTFQPVNKVGTQRRRIRN